MKNPYGVEPDHLMKRKGSRYAIYCNSNNGPTFGDILNKDLIISDHCNEDDDCFIHNDGKHTYECHPEHKSSLFVNTAGPNEKIFFSVLDYEVFTY